MAPKSNLVFETAIDTYQGQEILGEGGAGTVYKVSNSDGEFFAVKLLDPHKTNTKKLKRFKNELTFCQRNKHKNIVTVLDHGVIEFKEKNPPFYVMPFYPSTLRKLMDDGIPHNKVLDYFAQILDGLDAAHLLGVWHRDLKPENILYNPNI